MYRNLIPFFRVLGTPSNSLWDGLQAYYTADNTPNDVLGTYNGTLVNGAAYGTGKINNGFSFDGVNDYFSLPDDMFTPTTEFTLSIWVKFNTLGGWFCNIGRYSLGKGLMFYITGNKIVSIISNAGNDIIGNVAGNPTITTGTWNHVVLSYSAGNVKYYTNGVKHVDRAPTQTPAYPSPCPTVFGAANAGTTNHCNCLIDEVALFDGTQWTDAQVTEAYNSGAGLQYPN